MKLTKILTLFFIACFIMAAVEAQSVPLPISGKVSGANAGVTIEVTNLRTGTTLSTQTSGAGEFLIDWTNAKEPTRTGDKFKIQVKGCATASCTKEITWNGEATLFVSIDSAGVQSCPVCQATTWAGYGAAFVIALVAGLVGYMGGGVKLYKNKLGQAIFQHTHLGVTGYHDANTKHANPKYAHRRWKDDPAGCVDDVKKIQEKGGLI